MTTTGASSYGQLEAAGPSSSEGPGAAEDSSHVGERKVHFQSNTDGEKNIRKFDGLAKNFKPQSEEGHEIGQSSVGQYLCNIW